MSWRVCAARSVSRASATRARSIRSRRLLLVLLVGRPRASRSSSSATTRNTSPTSAWASPQIPTMPRGSIRQRLGTSSAFPRPVTSPTRWIAFEGRSSRRRHRIRPRRSAGRRAYEDARVRRPVELQPVQVTVHELALLSWSERSGAPPGRVQRRLLRTVARARPRPGARVWRSPRRPSTDEGGSVLRGARGPAGRRLRRSGERARRSVLRCPPAPHACGSAVRRRDAPRDARQHRCPSHLADGAPAIVEAAA